MRYMTLNRLTQNPAGDAVTLYKNKVYNEHFKNEFTQYMFHKGDDIKFENVRIGNFLFIRLLLPSAALGVKRNYDVVFKITYNPSIPLGDRSIQVFSNVPSFTYTYAKVFNERKYLINELIDLYPSKVFTQSTGYRNRLMTEEAPKGFIDRVKVLSGRHSSDKIWFDRYLFYAAEFILTNRTLMDDNSYRVLGNVNQLNDIIVKPLRSIEYISTEVRVDKKNSANNNNNNKLDIKQESRGFRRSRAEQNTDTFGSGEIKKVQNSNRTKTNNRSGSVKKVKRTKRI